MQSQNYLKIWFKDGHTERHFMNLVQNISATKYDLEGNLHNDYQMQQIVMEDTTYSYYIADIDSMSFRKVDKEKIKADYENVTAVVNQIFQHCKSSEEMATHLNEILNVDGVEEAYSNGSDFVVQIRDWRSIIYHFHDESGYDIEEQLNEIHSLLKKISHTRGFLNIPTPLKIAICHQMGASSNWDVAKEKMEELQSECDAQVFDVHFIPNEETGEDFDFDFWENNLSNFDLVLINTHGGKLVNDRVHVMCTTIPYEVDDDLIAKYDFNEVGIEVFAGEVDEVHGNNQVSVGYWCITENFINNRGKEFQNPAIIFSTACHSLEGFSKDEEIPSENIGISIYRKGNDSFAQALIGKGAGAYIGYNNEVFSGYITGIRYLKNLLNGLSVEESYDHLALLDKKQSNSGQAELIDIMSPSVSRDYFIKKNETLITSDAQALQDYMEYGKVILMGLTTILNRDITYVKYGFLYGDSPQLDPLKDQVIASNIYDVDMESGNVLFTLDILKPTPGQKRYYQAFTYDGRYFNLGDICDFTFPETAILSLGTNNIELTVGWTRTVDITSGSGSYVIESDDEFVATAFVDGNTISINALNPGEATITVSDKVSGQTQTIKVTVTGQADTRELMVTKTVNKTVYSLYKKTLDENNYRTNPDGWRCYRSELVLDIIKDGRTESYVIDNNIYLDKKNNHHTGQHPCLLLDFNKNMIGVFCSSKESGNNYDMDGYYYSSSMSNISFSKETVFEGYNWGWFPYFRDYGDDNINLCNFSYDGYFTILAVRTSGSWDLYYDNKDISPDAAQQIWERIGSVLVIGKNQDDEVDDRIHALIPDEIRDVIDEYIPIYDGMNPPNIEGSYYLSPQILIGSSLSYDQIGKEYAVEYQKYSNQDMVNNTIDMVRVEGSNGVIGWSKGSGAFISGTGNNFTIFFDQTGESYETNEAGESYTIPYKWVYIVSGTKTATGIKDLTVGFVMKEKGYDPEEKIVDVGTFRFFTDPDGISEATSWPYGNQYGAKKRVKQGGSELPSILNNNRKKLTPLK